MKIERISVGTGGVQNGTTSRTGYGVAITNDGNFVVFESYADDLGGAGSDQSFTPYPEVYLYNRSTDTITRISTTGAGVRADGASFDPTITPDGRYVVMKTQAANITGTTDVMIIRKDLTTGEIEIVGPGRIGDENPTETGTSSDLSSVQSKLHDEPSISDDGRFVSYTAPDGRVLRYDIQLHQTEVANAFPDGTEAHGLATAGVAQSADGRYVAFYSDVQFAPEDTAGDVPSIVYPYTRPSFDIFIKDMVTGTIERVSNSYLNPGQHPDRDSNGPAFSGDGRYLVYTSYASDIVPGDSNGFADIIRYDRTTGESEIVSRTSAGTEAMGPGHGSITPQISGDGRYVVFESSATNLRLNDVNGVQEIFVKDMVTGEVKGLSFAADGTPANGNSFAPSISENGRFVTFTSQAASLNPDNDSFAAEVYIVDLAESGFWQGVEKVGGNVQVNTHTAGDQFNPVSTALPDGRFLLAWSDTSVQQVKARFFDSAGVPQGDEFSIMAGSSSGYDMGIVHLSGGRAVVFQGTAGQFGKIIEADGSISAGFVDRPAGASGYFYTTGLTNGGFVISCSANGYRDIAIQAYDASGHKVGSLFVVPSGTFNEFVTREAVAFGNGGYGLLYDQVSTGLLLQRFDANGSALGSATRISNSTSDINYHSQVDALLLTDGRSFVAWAQDGYIHGRFIDADGMALGSDMTIGAGAASGQNWPHLAQTTDGHIAVSWTVGTSLYSLMLRADATSISPATILSTAVSPGWDVTPCVLPNGDVLYAWRGSNSSGEGAKARVVDSNGLIVSSETLLNSVTNGNQYGGEAVANNLGTILLPFEDGSGLDGSSVGLFAQVLKLNGFEPPACFLAGTMIRTPSGETAVEKLAIGDRVMTADGRALPVRFIGRQTIVSRFADPVTAHPILIRAGALDEGVPARDLHTSPGHGMVLGGTLVVAGALVNGGSITRMAHVPERFTYFHIELDEHALIFAEGAPTESFCNNVPREIFDNAGDYRALYGDGIDLAQLDMPTVKSPRQLPASLKRHLEARSQALAAAKTWLLTA